MFVDHFTLFVKAFEQVTVYADEATKYDIQATPLTYTEVYALKVWWSAVVIATSSKPSAMSNTENSITVSTDKNDTMVRNLTWKCQCYKTCPSKWNSPTFDDSAWVEVLPMSSKQNDGMGDDAMTLWPQDCKKDTACCRAYLGTISSSYRIILLHCLRLFLFP